MSKKFVTISVSNKKLRLFSLDIKKVYSRRTKLLPTIPTFQHIEDRLPKVSDQDTDSC